MPVELGIWRIDGGLREMTYEPNELGEVHTSI